MENVVKDELESVRTELARKEAELAHYIRRTDNQTKVINKIITIGKAKEQKASRNFTKIVGNLNSDNAKTTLLRKLISSCDNPELLKHWNEIISNSIPE